jgi:hypothetical protein
MCIKIFSEKKSDEEESYDLLTDDDSMIPQKLRIATSGDGESHYSLPHFQKTVFFPVLWNINILL